MFKSRLLRTQEEADLQIQLAPLIDMMFILLIFFLVTTSFIGLAGVQIQRPVSKTASGLATEVIYVGVDQKGNVYLEGRPVSLLSLRGRVRTRLKGRNIPVVIVPDSHTEAQALINVFDECQLAGAKEVSIGVKKEELAGEGQGEKRKPH